MAPHGPEWSIFGPKIGPKILIFMEGSKCFGTHLMENHLDTLFALFFRFRGMGHFPELISKFGHFWGVGWQNGNYPWVWSKIKETHVWPQLSKNIKGDWRFLGSGKNWLRNGRVSEKMAKKSLSWHFFVEITPICFTFSLIFFILGTLHSDVGNMACTKCVPTQNRP